MAHPSKITGRTGCPRPRTHTWGVLIHATGDVKKGFKFDVKRSCDFTTTAQSSRRQSAAATALQNVKVPGKSFNESKRAILSPTYRFWCPLVGHYDLTAKSGTMVLQRNCQTWIVESADELVARSFFEKEVAAYLDAIEQ
ncbi:hypothetical protein HYQ46_008860 [Verticillium longisporum]|nr:hypothetical protein HYQ46_008860 [Verticillium longisporum]